MNQKTILSWLTGCPASDINFKNAVVKASVDTCREALRHVTAKGAIAAISARLRKAEKEAPPQAPTGMRAMTLGDLDVLPPVRRSAAGKPMPLEEIEENLQQSFARIQDRTLGYHNEVIYDIAATGLMLLKAEQAHLLLAQPETVSGKSRKRSEKGQLMAAQGFTHWLTEKCPHIQERTARNYRNLARNIGMTSDHTLEDVEQLRATAALHGRSPSDFYRTPEALKNTPAKTEDHAPAPNLVHDAVRDGFSCLDSFVVLRDQMEPEDFEGVCTRLRETLQKLTGQRWAPADDINDAAQHGELHEAKAKGEGRKAKKAAAIKARWAARKKGGRK